LSAALAAKTNSKTRWSTKASSHAPAQTSFTADKPPAHSAASVSATVKLFVQPMQSA